MVDSNETQNFLVLFSKPSAILIANSNLTVTQRQLPFLQIDHCTATMTVTTTPLNDEDSMHAWLSGALDADERTRKFLYGTCKLTTGKKLVKR